MGFLLKLALGGFNIAKLVGRWIAAFFASLNKQGMIGLAVSLVLGVLCLHNLGQSRHWHKQSDRFEKLYTAEHTGRLADRAAYAKAQTDAAALNDKQIVRVKQKQQEITDASVANLDSRLVLIRGELRKQQNAAPQRPSGVTQAGNTSQSPCTAFDPSWLCLSPAERLSAAENEERHDELIDWAIQQGNVDPNAP